MGPSLRITTINKYPLLIILVLLVFFAVVARPEAVLTFGIVALAGILSSSCISLPREPMQ